MMRHYLRKFGRVLVILIIIAGLSGVIGWLIINFFRIQKVEVIGDSVDVVIDENRFPRNLIFFPTKQVENQILANNPLIDSVIIQKKFPQTLIINLKQRQPLARLVSRDQEIYLGPDATIMTNVGEIKQLPLILVDVEISGVNLKADQRIKKALEFLEHAKTASLVIESIRFYESQSLSARLEKTDILFAQSREMSAVIATLQNLINGFRIKGNRPARIDLRFDKPVITF